MVVRPEHTDPRRATPPTLEVVAARAGVSRATAGRVLAGAHNVSEAARDAVLRAAEETAYTPNRAARSLVTRRSDSIAFLVSENEDRLFGDPFFSRMLRGAHAELASAGKQLVFVIASSPTELSQFLHYAGGGHVDGVLLISLHGDDRLPQDLARIGVPTVLSGRPFSGDPELFYVDSDNRGGARTATELLIARGCRRVATITGPQDMCAGIDRLDGYRDALADAGRRTAKRLIVGGDFTAGGGADAMTRLLRHAPDIDGVFVASDLMAMGAVQALNEHGRKVPDDVAVVGFDDLRDAASTAPPLTTMRQQVEALGRLMAQSLLRLTAGESIQHAQVLPVETVRRLSA
ncbi:MAG: LacI family DNA-binding transcriptional regulator [Jatrophihabitans sp.]